MYQVAVLITLCSTLLEIYLNLQDSQVQDPRCLMKLPVQNVILGLSDDSTCIKSHPTAQGLQIYQCMAAALP